MPYYESVFIARQDFTTQQTDALAAQLTDVIAKSGGKITKKENWGLRNLAYRIKKNRKGNYVLLNIDAPAAAITEFERQMRINEDILRYLTIKVEQLENGPSPILAEGSDFRPKKTRIAVDTDEAEEIEEIEEE
ncbi:MAG: 30S ribosomal protein S6 [Alphaproteobacteria bacterium]